MADPPTENRGNRPPLAPSRNPILQPAPADLTIAQLVGDPTAGRDHLRHTSRHVKRDWQEPFRLARANQAIGRLPRKGEAIHMIQAGDFALCDLIPAALDLMAPASIRHLTIATLSFNRKNRLTLLELMDAGRIGCVDFLCSTMFEKGARAQCREFEADLADRGGRFLCVRCHAKIICMETTSRASYVIEGSANLRSCRAIEQFFLTNDPGLLEFHRAWMEGIFKHAETTNRRTIGGSAASITGRGRRPDRPRPDQ
jgi:hypothetical protein